MSKKTGKSEKESATYDTRDIVLGKVRGYPPWPGMVVDPDSVPAAVLKERPTTKKTQFYCVRFFPTGDFAWLVSKDISKLKSREIQSYINEPNKKSGDLLQGYRIALDPTKWEEEREAESRLAAEEEANAEVDELESDNDDSAEGDDGGSKVQKSKKRKRDSDGSASTKAKKMPKKKDLVESRKKPGPSVGKGKKNGRKSNAMVESEEEDGDNVAAGDGDIGPSKKGSPPPAKRAKRDKEDDGDDGQSPNLLYSSLNEAFEVIPSTSPQSKISTDPEAMKVRDWRHKLQKTFLSHKGNPKEEEMPIIDALFSTVENYDKITIEYLQFSKIGKVMRHIAVLPDEKVPRDAEFKFKDRADALVKKWQQILNANKPANAPNATVESIGAAVGPLSAAPISTAPLSQDALGIKDEDAAVTQGTAAISLNGKPVNDPSASTGEQLDNMATITPTTVVQDVAMTDAA